MKIEKNIGETERLLRLVAGVALLGIALSGVSPLGWLGLIVLATAGLRYCPLYPILGIRTKIKMEEDNPEKK